MLTISQKSFGIMQNDLFAATARIFGFNRTGSNITQAMQSACEYLIANEKVKVVSGKIIVNDSVL
jgi:hypothetical protein